MTTAKRIGVLTAGGDCPGLNAVIRAVVKCGLRRSPPLQVVGIQDGYAGLVLGKVRLLSDPDVSGILPRGGTILGTSNRDNPFKFLTSGEKEPRDRSGDALATIERERLDGIIAIGGDGTLRCARDLMQRGLRVVGVPKTIDNDLGSTDQTFGFDSALSVATEAVDRLHSTAESHHRVLICEVMGRNAGWIALRAGIAGGGDVILLPEIPFDLEKVCRAIRERVQRGKTFSILVVAEGAKPVGGEAVAQGVYRGADGRPRLGGVGNVVGQEIEARTGIETRVVILGHLQRGGVPTPFDRWLATRFGVHASALAAEGRWGRMVALRGSGIDSVPIPEAVQTPRLVDPAGEEVAAARCVGTNFGD